MSQERTDLVGEVRVKLPLPLVIPILSLGVIAVSTFAFSRILLAVPKEAATLLAMVMAANVLGAFAFLATRPEAARASWPELALVVMWPLLAGIAIAVFDVGQEAAHGATEVVEEPGAGSGETEIVAEGLAFDTASLTLPAGEQVSLHFANNDPGVQHNVSIYEDDSADPGGVLFKGDAVNGGSDITYEFEAPPKGEYYFVCDFHTGMNGTVTAE